MCNKRSLCERSAPRRSFDWQHHDHYIQSSGTFHHTRMCLAICHGRRVFLLLQTYFPQSISRLSYLRIDRTRSRTVQLSIFHPHQVVRVKSPTSASNKRLHVSFLLWCAGYILAQVSAAIMPDSCELLVSHVIKFSFLIRRSQPATGFSIASTSLRWKI